MRPPGRNCLIRGLALSLLKRGTMREWSENSLCP
jgi:hypothetical protein